MKTDFTKPSGDVALETGDFIASDDDRLARQKHLARHLNAQPQRQFCILCRHSLEGSFTFLHRETSYLRCGFCDHVQSRNLPPRNYPHDVEEQGFETIYPNVSVDTFVSRRKRVYDPKRDWLVSCLEGVGWTRQRIEDSTWLEMGCGGGYFLASLLEAGIKNVSGIDRNADLVDMANGHLDGVYASVNCEPLSQVIAGSSVDVFASFFVLEHLEDANDVWAALSEKTAGTVFAFAVPTFGFATLLESAFPDFSARNLDSVLHTQLYTDRSIRFALDQAGFEMVGVWVFGQDAIDMKRLIMKRLAHMYDRQTLGVIDTQIAKMVDDVQGAIDRNWLADARHVVAIKT